jgi:hypothetical protein
MCYYMSYLPLYHLVLFIEIDFYVLLHELSPIICELFMVWNVYLGFFNKHGCILSKKKKFDAL